MSTAQNNPRELAIALLDSPSPLWNDLTGTLYSWSDEDVLEIGRARFHGDDGLLGEAVSTAASVARNTSERWFRFWATSSPWQLRIEAIRERISPDYQDAHTPEVMITDRFNWWLKREGHVESGEWPPDRIFVDDNKRRWAGSDGELSPYSGAALISPGVENLDLLLKPEPLTRAFSFQTATHGEVGGRSAIVLHGRPRGGHEFYRAAAGLVVLGAEEYVLAVDARCGIVLGAAATVGPNVARRQVIEGLTVDDHVDGAIFTPSE